MPSSWTKINGWISCYPWLGNGRSVTTAQTAVNKDEDMARAEALKNASFENLTPRDKQLRPVVKSSSYLRFF